MDGEAGANSAGIKRQRSKSAASSISEIGSATTFCATVMSLTGTGRKTASEKPACASSLHATMSVWIMPSADGGTLGRISTRPSGFQPLLAISAASGSGFAAPAAGEERRSSISIRLIFRCRHCLGLPYASQQETILDRAYRKAFKLRNRLNAGGGIGDPIWGKPKGMHWSTFERLKAKVEHQDEITNFAFIDRASKMLGWT